MSGLLKCGKHFWRRNQQIILAVFGEWLTMEEIKKLLDSDKLIIGLKRTMKFLRKAKVEKVILAKDCPESFKEDIEYYGNFADVKIEQLTIPCDELGSVCKKPFPITIIGILK